MIKYLSSHWRGEQSLARSYWVNGVLVFIPLNIFGQMLEQLDVSGVGPAFYTLLFAIYFAIALPLLAWSYVGIFRAASSHIVNTSRKFWARFAQVIASLNLISLPFLVYVYGAIFWNFAQIITGADGLEPATITMSENGYLVLDGYIDFETPDMFEQALAENLDVQLIELESLGGYLEPASIIARMVKERGLETYTSYECTSACTHIFIAGSARYIDFDGLLGFHRADLDGIPAELIVSVLSEVDQIFVDQGVPASFVDRVNAVPAEEVWYPFLKELLDANLITHIYDYNADETYDAADYCEQNDCSVVQDSLEESDDS